MNQIWVEKLKKILPTALLTLAFSLLLVITLEQSSLQTQTLYSDQIPFRFLLFWLIPLFYFSRQPNRSIDAQLILFLIPLSLWLLPSSVLPYWIFSVLVVATSIVSFRKTPQFPSQWATAVTFVLLIFGFYLIWISFPTGYEKVGQFPDHQDVHIDGHTYPDSTAYIEISSSAPRLFGQIERVPGYSILLFLLFNAISKNIFVAVFVNVLFAIGTFCVVLKEVWTRTQNAKVTSASLIATIGIFLLFGAQNYIGLILTESLHLLLSTVLLILVAKTIESPNLRQAVNLGLFTYLVTIVRQNASYYLIGVLGFVGLAVLIKWGVPSLRPYLSSIHSKAPATIALSILVLGVPAGLHMHHHYLNHGVHTLSVMKAQNLGGYTWGSMLLTQIYPNRHFDSFSFKDLRASDIVVQREVKKEVQSELKTGQYSGVSPVGLRVAIEEDFVVSKIIDDLPTFIQVYSYAIANMIWNKHRSLLGNLIVVGSLLTLFFPGFFVVGSLWVYNNLLVIGFNGFGVTLRFEQHYFLAAWLSLLFIYLEKIHPRLMKRISLLSTQ